jgi:hypothetical protein
MKGSATSDSKHNASGVVLAVVITDLRMAPSTTLRDGHTTKSRKTAKDVKSLQNSSTKRNVNMRITMCNFRAAMRQEFACVQGAILSVHAGMQCLPMGQQTNLP